MNAETPQEPPGWVRHPVDRLRWWWTKKPPSNRDTALITAAVTYVGLLILAIVGAVFAALKGDVSIPVWVLAAGVGAASLVGLVAGFTIIRALYQPQLAEAKLEATVERERRAALEPDSEAMERFGVYSDYIFRLFDDISASLPDFIDPTAMAVQNALCELPSEAILETADVEIKLSLWFEGNPDQLRENIPSDRLKARVRTFWIPCSPDHTGHEHEDFEKVPIRSSWISYSRQLQEDDPSGSERVYKLDDLGIAGVGGRDIDAFRKYEYKSVRATAFRFGTRSGYLVGLSPSARPLSQAEDRFIGLLGAAMSTAGDLAVANGLFSAS